MSSCDSLLMIILDGDAAVGKLHLCQAIFDMNSCTICEACLTTWLNFVDVEVVWDLVELTTHLLHNIAIFIIWVRLDRCRKPICCFLNLFTIIARFELHYCSKVFLLFWIKYIWQLFLGRLGTFFTFVLHLRLAILVGLTNSCRILSLNRNILVFLCER